VRVALSGVGARHPRQLVEALGGDGIDALIAVGLAGALSSHYGCGDVIAARRAVSEAPASTVTSDTRLIEAASRCGAKVVDAVLSVERIAGHIDEKRRLAERAEVVDMESYRILDEARRCGIPSAAIRVIGDTVEETLPLDFNQSVRADGSVNLMNLASQAIRAPWRWPALAAFGYRQRLAAHALADFLDRFVTTVATSMQ
jgi:nucleoside phosphorylase